MKIKFALLFSMLCILKNEFRSQDSAAPAKGTEGDKRTGRQGDKGTKRHLPVPPLPLSILTSILLLLMVWGCAGMGKKGNVDFSNSSLPPTAATPSERPQMSDYANIPPATDEAPPLVNDGSLWKDSSASGYLFADPKARSVGDIVTINILENASASGNASTKTGKKSTLSADISSLLGLEKSVTKHNANLDPTNLLSASASNNFDGSGESSRSGKVTATISARVTHVLTNGDMAVRGTRQVIINNEKQLITIEGIIRPEDIAPDNTIASTSIADARIAYTGKGIVSDKQSPGWLSRIIDVFWPF